MVSLFKLTGILAIFFISGCSEFQVAGDCVPGSSSLFRPVAGNCPPTNQIVTMPAGVERKRAIMATGYAVISVQPGINEAQQRLMAIRASKLDAYRGLTEQVYGQYLDASTTVADLAVMNDTFRSKVEGVIFGAKLVSINPVGDDTYETTMSLDQTVVDDLRSLYYDQVAQNS